MTTERQSWVETFGETELTRALDRFQERVNAAGLDGETANSSNFALIASDLELDWDEIEGIVPALYQQAMISVAHVQGNQGWPLEKLLASIIALTFTQAIVVGIFVERERRQPQREAA